MAESIKIEIFRKKDAEDFTLALADPESRAETGSGTAMTAAVASRCCSAPPRLTAELPENERVDVYRSERRDPAQLHGQPDRRGREGPRTLSPGAEGGRSPRNRGRRPVCRRGLRARSST